MNTVKTKLIAPCGMNCNVCMAYLRDKNRCLGCRYITPKNSISRTKCKIKNCKNLKKTKSGFCFECKDFPCERIKHLDKRYRTKYNMSEIENLLYIKKFGIKKLVEKENKKWTCKKCGGTISCHRRYCFSCGAKK